jgi:hypothetical protein
MRTLLSLIIVTALARPLAAQDQPRWEYGILGLRGGVPVGWSAGDSSGNARALIRAAEERERAAGMKRSADLLISVFNELDRQGWEFLQATSVGLIFRRQRQP